MPDEREARPDQTAATFGKNLRRDGSASPKDFLARQTKPDQTRPDQTRSDQTRPDQTREREREREKERERERGRQKQLYFNSSVPVLFLH